MNEPIIQTAVSEALAECIAIDKTIVGNERKTMSQFIDLGKALWKLKNACAHGEWLKTLAKSPITQQRASQAMRAAKLRPGVVSKSSSIRDLLDELPKPEGETDEPNDGGSGVGTSESAPTDSTEDVDEPEPPKLCRSCRLGTPKPKCKACAELNKPDDEEEEESEPEAPKPVMDAEGHEVPESCLEAFANLERFKALDSQMRELQKAIDELSRLPGGENLKVRLTPTGAEGKTVNKHASLNELKRDIKFTRPHSVCPWCQGKGKNCKACNGRAWVEKMTWDNADADTKAQL